MYVRGTEGVEMNGRWGREESYVMSERLQVVRGKLSAEFECRPPNFITHSFSFSNLIFTHENKLKKGIIHLKLSNGILYMKCVPGFSQFPVQCWDPAVHCAAAG